MIRRLIVLAWLVGLGCSSHQPSETSSERRLRELQDEVYQLRRAQEALEDRLARMERRQGMSTAVPAARERRSPPVQAVGGPSADPIAGRSLERARAAHADGRHGDAVQALNAWLNDHPGDRAEPEALYLLGESYYALGNFAQAIVEFDKLVEAHPRDSRAPDALHKVGLSYYELGYERNAFENLDRLRDTYPESRAAVASKPLWQRLRSRSRR